MNFKRYNESDNSWTDSHYIKKTDTDTITTLPATVYPLAQTATIGLKGNTVQNGTPTPNSPIIPEGCGERTGNLCSNIAYKTNYSINAQGVETAFSGFNIYAIPCEANTTYTISLSYFLSGTTVRIHTYNNGVWIEQTAYASIQNLPLTFTTPNNADEIRISITNAANNKIMLNLGSTDLPYEPFGVKIPILSANTTTPVYLGEVQSTRQIKQLVFDGTENWGEPTNGVFRLTISDYLRESGNIPVNTHYKGIDVIKSVSGLGDKETAFLVSSSGNNYFYIEDSNYNLQSFVAYLQQQYSNGTPVTVWYVLATPTTGIVNEPLRKIGDYADTVSGITIPTIAGADSFDVLTTLKPSEVELTYTGWHDATVKEWDGSEWQ